MSLLAELPASYDSLREKYGIPIDYVLRNEVKRGNIWRRVIGGKVLYCLPLPPIPDEVIHDNRVKKGRCRNCGEPVFRKGAKYCTQECLWKSMIIAKPNCQRCGKEVREKDHKFCSRECRWPKRGYA